MYFGDSIRIGLAEFLSPEFFGLCVVGEDFAELGGVLEFVGDAHLAFPSQTKWSRHAGRPLVKSGLPAAL